MKITAKYTPVPALLVSKETIQEYHLVATTPNGELIELAHVKWYKSRRTRGGIIHCMFWLQVPGLYVSGYGEARGSGYDKKSTAFGHALTSAGVKLDEEVAFKGDGAVRKALEAIADILGYDKRLIV